MIRSSSRSSTVGASIRLLGMEEARFLSVRGSGAVTAASEPTWLEGDRKLHGAPDATVGSPDIYRRLVEVKAPSTP